MQRELNAYFYSSIAYVVLTVFLIVTGIFFISSNFTPGGESSLRELLGNYMPLILVFILPMLTMRLLAEEYRGGTIETLMTAPVSEVEVVLGKFLGAMFFYGIMLATSLVYAVIISVFGRLDIGLLLCTYLGLVLLGAMYVAVGLFFSACTRNQIVAVICSFVLLAIITLLASFLAQDQSGLLRLVLLHLSVLDHFRDFGRGLVDTNHLFFFATTTGLFLFLAVKVLESRRWR
jgi:ABC-2 type transport system permease protein